MIKRLRENNDYMNVVRFFIMLITGIFIVVNMI